MKKALLWLLGIVIIAGIGFGGWYIGNKQAKKDDNKTQEKTPKKDTKIKVEYKTDKYEKSTDNKGLVISSSFVKPISINVDNGEKIIHYMDNVVGDLWSSIIRQTDKSIENYDPDFQFDAKYGINYTTTDYLTSKTLTFNIVSEGDMGGVGWHESYYYNFDIESGELLELNDICIDVKNCKTFMREYFLKVLQRDERFNSLDLDYEEGIEESIYKVSNYGFTKNGFIMIVPEYEISDGAAGAFAYTIPYDEFNKYLKDEYQM